MNRRLSLACVAAASVAAASATADIINVPEDHPTIQEGIDAAVDGDEVVVADGTWTGNGNKNLDFGGRLITLRSESGDPTLCIIDCENDGRGFHFHSGETNAAIVAGFTIRGGVDRRDGGGGMHIEGSSPTVMSCAFIDNTSYSGFSPAGETDQANSIASRSGGAAGSGGGGEGGGMANADASPPIEGSLFCGNEPEHVSGVWTDRGGNEFLDECCPADLDGSGVVDFGDILAVLAVWGSCEGCPEDLDDNGVVDVREILIVLAAWGACPG